jgi:phosphoribosylformylglycinamidine synthase subunit PurQ / glutaminase
MDVTIISFPGTNCDVDTANAVSRKLNTIPKIISCKEKEIPKSDLIIIPGGFSYGDYLRSGAIAAREPIMLDLVNKAKNGVYILGICNGFQILTEVNLLPGVLLKNNSLKFISKTIKIKIIRNDTFFTSSFAKNETVSIPVAHHDGNFFIEKKALMEIEDNQQIAMRYVDPINGSLNDIAGLYNQKFNVLGLMPHPERAIDIRTGSDDGIKFFESMLNFVNI